MTPPHPPPVPPFPQNGPPDNCTGAQGASAPPPSAEATAAGWPFAGRAERPQGTGNCTIVETPNNCNPGPCWTCNITLHASADMDAPGPWNPHPTAIIGLSNLDNMCVRCSKGGCVSVLVLPFHVW